MSPELERIIPPKVNSCKNLIDIIRIRLYYTPNLVWDGQVYKKISERMEIIFTEHALFEIQRRQISKQDVEDLIKLPVQQIKTEEGNFIFQKKYFDTVEHKEMLLRVIGKENKQGFIIITAYKTSKISKYWK